MKDILSLIGKIREQGNTFIMQELHKNGVRGLVPSHGDILALLYGKSQVTMKELAEQIHRTRPTVTVLVDKLEKLGYVLREKSKTDTRVTYVKLTPQGKQFEPLFEGISKELNKLLYKNLSKEDQTTVYQLLQKMLYPIL